MRIMSKTVFIGSLLSGAFLMSATAPAGAVDALGVAGAVGNFVGAVAGGETPVVDERIGGLVGHGGKGGGKLSGSGGKHGGGGGGGGGKHHK